MPPEQFPWDRRDFRKHERSGSDPRFAGGGFGGGGPHRWREQHLNPHAPMPPHPQPYNHTHNMNHHQQQRCYSDFRSSRPIPPGHGKQGGWPMYPDDAGHGFIPFTSRYGDRNMEDDNFRPFGNRGDGRYFRNSRESRGSFSQRDWRSSSWEPAASSSGPGRPASEVNNQMPVENTETCHDNGSRSTGSAHPHPPDSLPVQSQSLVKESNEKNGDVADELASPGQKSDKENGLGTVDWKPLKWSQSGSLSSRGSGLSHSSSSKSMGVDTDTVVKNVTPIQSPAAVCVGPATAPALSDETCSRKKPRLGWGEGLAKYEKKKVDGPEEVATRDGLVVSVNHEDNLHSPSIHLIDKSPRVASFSDCTESATPTSVACSSSPGIEEKKSVNAVNIDQDTANWSCSPSTMSQAQYDGPAFNLENLELASIANLSSLINELVQSDYPSSVETGYVRNTSMNKLLVWKVNILKALEVTESEIDLLETELKSMVAEGSAASSLLPGDCRSKPREELLAGSCFTAGSVPFQIVSSQAMNFENLPEDGHRTSKDEEIDSPGSATSKLIEMLPSGPDTFPSESQQCVDVSMRLQEESFHNLGKCLEDGLSNQGETCSDNHKLIETNCHDLAGVGDTHSKIIYDSILSSNKIFLKIAMEELNMPSPNQQRFLDISTLSRPSFRSDPLLIKEFLNKKRCLQFREKAVALKFKVFQHFWKEGRVILIRKLQGKSHKKFDLSHIGYKKNRSSSRSRISFSGGCIRTVPAEEVINYTMRLLSQSPFKPYRSTLKMPALILDKDVRMSRFITNNALVEDPCTVEKERSTINPWTSEERELFIDKLAIFGKNFSKIASFLEHKTIADCIEFYYKNHKLEHFERARKKPDFAKNKKSQSSTYLVASGKRWNREVNAASLDILGEASAIIVSVNDAIESQQKSVSRMFFGASSSHKAPMGEDVPLQKSSSLDMCNNETVAADVLAGICGSLSSEAMSSCNTSSVDRIDGYQDRRIQRVGSCVKRPMTPDVTQNIDDEYSDDSCGEMNPADWTDEEKPVFIQAVLSYGKDFTMISQCVRTRSKDQCKVFFSKARKCLELDKIQPVNSNAVSADGNGGASDTEDACVVHTCPITVNDSSEFMMEEDCTPADMKLLSNNTNIAGTPSLEPDSNGYPDDRGPRALDSMAAEPVMSSSTGIALIDHNQAVEFNVNGEGACGREFKVTTLAVTSNNSSVVIEKGDHGGEPTILSETDIKAMASNGYVGEDNEGQKTIAPEDNLENKKLQDNGANSTEGSSILSAANVTVSGPHVGNISHPSVDAHPRMQIGSGCQMETDPQTSSEKSVPISMEQNGHFSTIESSTLFSVPIQYQRHSSTNALSNGGTNGISEKDSQKIVRTVDCQQHSSGYSRSVPDEFSHILKGYPVSVQTLKEMNGDVNCKKHIPLHNVSKWDGKLHSDQRGDFSLQKCTGPKHQGEAQVPFPSQDKSRDHSRPRSANSSDVEKPSRNGNVKLFGKILTSPSQKPDSCIEGKGGDDQNKPGYQTLNLRFTGDQKVDLDSSKSKFDCNNFIGTESSPRSYRFWDGKRTNTGFTPLPDSDLLLAKYPAAFSNNHLMPSVKSDKPPLHGVMRNNDPPLNGISVFPNRELSSSNRVTDYQVLRNLGLPTFSLDTNEMHRRNSFEVISGMQLQQQSRGIAGINVIGRGGFVGQCSGISDPVAAIKMHYAKAQNLGMQAGNGVREDDAWTSNGDVGKSE